MAADGNIVTVNNVEQGVHRFVVGDALVVGAFDDAYDVVGEFDRLFLLDLEVTDYVDVGRRSDQCDTVEDSLREEYIGHLDYALGAEAVGREIVANGDMGVETLDAEDTDSAEQLCRRNVVDNGAAGQSSYGEMFLFV